MDGCVWSIHTVGLRGIVQSQRTDTAPPRSGDRSQSSHRDRRRVAGARGCGGRGVCLKGTKSQPHAVEALGWTAARAARNAFRAPRWLRGHAYVVCFTAVRKCENKHTV